MPTKPNRSPEIKLAIFETIQRIHAQYPDLRFGQIIENAVYGRKVRCYVELFTLEDSDLLGALQEFEARPR